MTRPLRAMKKINRKLGQSPGEMGEGPLGRQRAETGEAGGTVPPVRGSRGARTASLSGLSQRHSHMLRTSPQAHSPHRPLLWHPSPCVQPARACHCAPDGRQLVSVHIASPQAPVKPSPQESSKHPSKVLLCEADVPRSFGDRRRNFGRR